jgi:hypothetical protein
MRRAQASPLTSLAAEVPGPGCFGSTRPGAGCRLNNPAEGVWANLKNGLGNLAARDVDQLAAVIRNRLKPIQYRPALIGGFLAQTGLSLEPEPP